MPVNSENHKKIVIVGGGFAGIKCALTLSKYKRHGFLKDYKIQLISDRKNFEYHGALYRLVTGSSPLEVCFPLMEIFKKKSVEVLKDRISTIDFEKKILSSVEGSKYYFDYLVLAVGAQTSYLDIKGLEKNSYSFKSIDEGLRLKGHIDDVIDSALSSKNSRDAEVVSNIVIVGAGASGVELAGELAVYANATAKKHDVSSELIKIDLVERADRILCNMDEAVSKEIHARLEDLGVSVYLNEAVTKETKKELFLTDLRIQSKTVVWTGGVVPNRLVENLEPPLLKEHGGFLKVDSILRPHTIDEKKRALSPHNTYIKCLENVFVAGDLASVDREVWGMASTALHHGDFIAHKILKLIKNVPFHLEDDYKPRYVPYIFPIGPGWAAFIYKNYKVYGRVGWFFRRIFDFKVYTSFLSVKDALQAFVFGPGIISDFDTKDNS